MPAEKTCGSLPKTEIGETIAMLILKPNCERCDIDLPPDSPNARICSFECTFCADCTENHLNNRCPTCGGNLVPRPIRPSALLSKYPASTERVLKQHP